jgi:hypothetical protein
VSESAPNSAERWHTIWADEGDGTWRGNALALVYDRIVQLCPANTSVLDIGGGVGLLGKLLADKRKAEVHVAEHNTAALMAATDKGLGAWQCDVLDAEARSQMFASLDPHVVVATEVLEHLPMEAVEDILVKASMDGGVGFFSVPNDRLPPEEEPQHERAWTALGFLQLLRKHWPDARVEVIGPDHKPGVGAFLLGVCGLGKKAYSLSMTLPVRDEAADLEAVLASFRGVADEIVVGVDPRTVDNTTEVAKKYAEVVFVLDSPRGPTPEEDKIPDNGVHFSWVRNQCIEKCSSNWIFMTEGHERLKAGHDVLLQLPADTMQSARICFVWRTGQGQRWGYPWMFRNDSRIRFKRPTHNALDYPDDVLCVKLPQVETWHTRDHANATKRAKQRRAQNRVTLLDDWKTRGNADSLYYLASEMREYAPEKAVDRMEEYLQAPSKNGPARYQTRLQLALEYKNRGDRKNARHHLMQAQQEDWSRVEHWLWLGDLSYEEEQFQQALQFYRYAATAMGDPPFSLWWIDEDVYQYLPAQRLAMTNGALGRLRDALHWAKRARTHLPDDAPAEVVEEADRIIQMLGEKVEENDDEGRDSADRR